MFPPRASGEGALESVSFDGHTYETQRVAVPGGSVATYSIGTGPEVLLMLH